MPPRKDPRTYNLVLRTHKLAVFLAVDSTSKVSTLAPRVLSALDQFRGTLDIPTLPDTLAPKDVALARARRTERRQVVPGEYDMLDGAKSVKEQLNHWETVFVMFRDPDGNFKVVVTLPPTLDDDDVHMDFAPPAPPPAQGSSTGAKRKAPAS